MKVEIDIMMCTIEDIDTGRQIRYGMRYGRHNIFPFSEELLSKSDYEKLILGSKHKFNLSGKSALLFEDEYKRITNKI